MSKEKYRKTPLMSISDYVKNTEAKRSEFSMTISPNGKKVITHTKTGHEFTEDEISEMYPTDGKLYLKTEKDINKVYSL